MKQSSRKYIQIRHWDYWWEVYSCGRDWAGPQGVEFSLTDDEDGEELFFHFDFYNLPGLRELLRQGELIQADDSEYPAFLRQAQELERGEREYFIGGLYYRHFTPSLAFCNQPLMPERTLLDLQAPVASPYYAVLFLAEERPLTPEVLTGWMTQLSYPLFGRTFSAVMAHPPTRAEALEQWKHQAADEI